jgi:hypothetical protein
MQPKPRTPRQAIRPNLVDPAPRRAAHVRRAVMGVAIGVMLIGACYRLPYDYYRLVTGAGTHGGLALKIVHEPLRQWFEGKPMYTPEHRAFYPPAAQVTLWPLIGWMHLGAARWAWALTATVGLAGLIALFVRYARQPGPLGLTFVVLIPMASYGVTWSIGNGQFGVHLLPCALVSILLVHRPTPRWSTDLIAALAMVFALTKPTLVAPLAWLIATCGRWRPVLMTATLYIAATVFAAAFQPDDPITLTRRWLRDGSHAAAYSSEVGEHNVQTWLIKTGLVEFDRHRNEQRTKDTHWKTIISLTLFAAAGAWALAYRRVDLWLRLGALALVCRFWVYHRMYDDLLLLVPILALLRLARAGPIGIAAVLAMMNIILAVAPVTFRRIPGWPHMVALTWLTTLGYLMIQAELNRRRTRPRPATA